MQLPNLNQLRINGNRLHGPTLRGAFPPLAPSPWPALAVVVLNSCGLVSWAQVKEARGTRARVAMPSGQRRLEVPRPFFLFGERGRVCVCVGGLVLFDLTCPDFLPLT